MVLFSVLIVTYQNYRYHRNGRMERNAMTLLQLQYFSTLAHVLHYTHAAQRLHISQPTLSYSISELEKELDIKLFEKQNRKVMLTDSGKCFLPYVERSLALLEEGKAAISRAVEKSGTEKSSFLFSDEVLE